MYDLTRDIISLLGINEVGYTFSVCLMDSGQLFLWCFVEGWIPCYPVFQVLGFIGLNELKRKLLISDTQHYAWQCPVSSVLFDAAHMLAQPLHSIRAASWLPAYTQRFSFHPSPGEDRVILSTFYRGGNWGLKVQGKAPDYTGKVFAGFSFPLSFYGEF